MNWFQNTFLNVSALQAVVIISLICAIGVTLGKLRYRGVGLGVTFVFFAGIMAGAAGIQIDANMRDFAESFGLVLFIYALGLQVGPAFVSSFREGGKRLNLWALGVVGFGTLMALLFTWCTPISFSDMMGVLCGATTNTPALAAAQETLKTLHLPGGSLALGCAITYPLGVVGVIIGLLSVRRFLINKNKNDDAEAKNNPFIASFLVSNPAIFHHKLTEVNSLSGIKFVVSRLWRNGEVFLPDADTVLESGDRILVIATQRDVPRLTVFFGQQDKTDWNKSGIDWNSIDSMLESQRIVITNHDINGKHLESLHLRNRYGVNVSRVYRAGIQLVATPDLTLRLGDRITVVGDKNSIKKVSKELGNTVKHLDEPNIVAIFVGIVLGLALGSIPFSIPGISIPVRLGLAGGPIIVGILIGAYGPRFHMVTYTTSSANLMLRALGLDIYLACLGLAAGPRFFETIVRPEGLLWVVLGVLITVVPVIIMAFASVKIGKLDFAQTSGMLCGAMANPMALDYVNETLPGDKAAVAYATVYPLCMFVRVILAQLLLMLLLG